MIEAMDFLQYVKPELFMLMPVLYAIGTGLKVTSLVADKFIPIALCGAGIALCILFSLAYTSTDSVSNVFEILFASIVQGVLLAACSTYANQIVKQLRKGE